MKTSLLLCVALTIALSITSVASLSCTVCTDSTDASCTSTASVACSGGETQCVSATIQTTSAGSVTTQKLKACAAATLCPSSNTFDHSLNVGSANVLAKAVCCSTDNCNSADAPTPTAPPTGTLKCYSCNPLTGACSADLACNTLETKCFSSSVIPKGGSTAIKGYGCSSGGLCDAAAALASSPLVANVGTIQGTPTCCNTGNNCNLPPTTAPPTTTTTTTTTTTPTTTTTTPTTTTQLQQHYNHTTTAATTAGASSVAAMLLLHALALVLALLS
ncbi:hypothetical protein WMY93_024342 [Mugilogobius chulae]|uniref:UPAR/Ly6 domain-containing protein n=1 Tax=Mugilogobius chulae TaxID=88201 RepID=A0AAW0N3V0_9GOBI